MHTVTNSSSPWQLPFAGEDIADMFEAIVYEEVFYPLSISLEAFEILQGVRISWFDFLMLT